MREYAFVVALMGAIGAFMPLKASAQVATTCTEAYRTCMINQGMATNVRGQGGLFCKRLRAKCMHTGTWSARQQQLTGLKRQ